MWDGKWGSAGDSLRAGRDQVVAGPGLLPRQCAATYGSNPGQLARSFRSAGWQVSLLLVARQEFPRHGRKCGILRVFFGDKRIRNAPGDGQVRIIPNDPILARGIVEVAALI